MIRIFVRVTESNYTKKSGKSNTLFARFFKKIRKNNRKTLFLSFLRVFIKFQLPFFLFCADPFFPENNREKWFPVLIFAGSRFMINTAFENWERKTKC